MLRPLVEMIHSSDDRIGLSKPVGASLLAMDVNDNACLLVQRAVLRSIAKVEPLMKPVGASLLAMDVNDNACLLDKRVVLRSIATDEGRAVKETCRSELARDGR
ncbi:hypothetical protein AEQ67_12685 [Pseudomonas sp. RIT-PI-q]|nr:hypothetical protein AEQ67_12685 [Pseudomonas sp. RIT-PI-q]